MLSTDRCGRDMIHHILNALLPLIKTCLDSKLLLTLIVNIQRKLRTWIIIDI